MAPISRPVTVATGYVLGACMSVQVGSALGAYLLAETGSLGAATLRLSLAALLLTAWARPRLTQWKRPQWQAALALGLCLLGMNICFYLALARIPLGAAVTLEFVGPLTLSALTSRRGRDIIFVAWALAGVLLLSKLPGASDSALDLEGVIFALVAGAFWALYILLATRVGTITRGMEGLAVATSVAAVLALPFGLIDATLALTRWDLMGLAVGTALLASFIPYSLEWAALRRLPPRTFSIMMSLEPAVATVVGWFILGQIIAWPTVLGITMVITASAGAAMTLAPSAHPKPTSDRC